MLATMFRKRAVDEQFLRHSEWVRRLGIPLVLSLAGIKSISLMLFIILPLSLTQLAGPSTVFALIFTFLAVFLAANHQSELSCAMPKNCVQYHFAYSLLGELPAFLIAWFSLADYIGQAALFCRAWAEHFNMLFRGLPAKSLTVEYFSKDSEILNPKFDYLCLIATLMTFTLLLCSLRVVGTICVSLIVVTLLIASSCSLVAFFHLDPDNWLAANFFGFGYQGVLYAICALTACYTGVESTSCLLEETKNPRKRITSVLNFLVVSLTIVFFVLALVFSLSTNVAQLNDNILIPEVFTVLNIPAARSPPPTRLALKRFPMIHTNDVTILNHTNEFRSHHEHGFIRMRYMLSVCSVCALSGAVLASFLPATRVIATMCQDKLLPYAKDKSTKSPYYAVILCTMLVSAATVIQTRILTDFVIFTAPIKLIITIVLTYFQHFLPEPIGIPEETSNYKSIGKKRIRVRIDDGVSIEESVRSDDESTVSRSTFDTTAFLYLKATKMETDRLQKKLERQNFVPKSVSQYHAIPSPQPHNCIAEQCVHRGDDDDEDQTSDDIHLFGSDEQEVPFFSSNTPRAATPTLMVSSATFNKSRLLLVLYLGSTALGSIYVRCFATSDQTMTSYTFCTVFFIVICLVGISICKLQTNDYLHKRTSRVPLFPFVSLVSLFLLTISLFGSAPIGTAKHIGVIMMIGCLMYILYGYRHSQQRHRRCFVVANQFSRSETRDEQYFPIIGDDSSQM